MTDNRSAVYELEEGSKLQLDFNKISKAIVKCPDIIPVAVQNADTKEVILIAYMNREALNHTIRFRIATFWSTSRNELWIKGETSGNTFEIVEIRVNCEQNSLVYIVRPIGEGICHTKDSKGKARDCYYRRIKMNTNNLEHLNP